MKGTLTSPILLRLNRTKLRQSKGRLQFNLNYEQICRHVQERGSYVRTYSISWFAFGPTLVSAKKRLNDHKGRTSKLDVSATLDGRSPIPSSINLYVPQDQAVAANTISYDRDRMSICLSYIWISKPKLKNTQTYIVPKPINNQRRAFVSNRIPNGTNLLVSSRVYQRCLKRIYCVLAEG